MKYNRFEDLPVWKAAIEFAVRIYALTARNEFRGRASLRDQLERASVSISNNVAEGFERGTTQELLTFIYISRGSSGESRSMLCFLDLLPPFAELKPEILDLKSRAVSISRQLGAWAASLKNSEIRGQRYMTDKTRHSAQLSREREEFLQGLRQLHEERIAKLENREGGEKPEE